MSKRLISAMVLWVLFVFSLPAQTGTGTPASSSQIHFDTSDFPSWGKDLRRAEIVAFGTFPFTVFTATFFMDTWRSYNHNWDTRYAPWPFKTAGAIDMTNQEHEITLAAAGIASLALAVTDFIIVQIKRHKDRQRILQLPPGSPIIIKRPWPDGASEDPGLPPDLSGESSDLPESPEHPVVP